MDRRKLRLLDASEELVAEVWGERHSELLFTHALLTSVSLPYRSQGEARSYTRTCGNVSLRLDAGAVPAGDGAWRDVPLPYGAKARLLMLHLTSEAIKTGSPVVEVEDSFTAFARSLNISTDARNLRRLRSQIEAMAAVRMALAQKNGSRIEVFQGNVFEGISAELPEDPRQMPLWSSVVRFSPRFYESARQRAVPLNRAAVMALKHSARCLDVYGWLAHRFYGLGKPVKVRWTSLRFQFGKPEQDLKSFKRRFKQALAQVLAVYPEAKVSETHGGIRLLPSPTPVKPLGRSRGLLGSS